MPTFFVLETNQTGPLHLRGWLNLTSSEWPDLVLNFSLEAGTWQGDTFFRDAAVATSSAGDAVLEGIFGRADDTEIHLAIKGEAATFFGAGRVNDERRYSATWLITPLGG